MPSSILKGASPMKRTSFPLRAYEAFFIFGGLSRGFTLCVVTLVFLSRGFSLAQLSLGMALQSVVSMLLELPSGMAGDLWGRKRVWIAGRAFSLAALMLYLFCSGPVLYLAFLCNGAASALSSGTIDAMFLDGWLAARGHDSLNKASMVRTVADTGGLAVGALAGGLLSSVAFWRPYTLNLLANAAMLGCMFLTAALFLPADPPRPRPTGQSAGPLRLLLAQGAATARAAAAAPALMVSLLGGALLGFVMIGPQAYWQPRLLELAGVAPGVLLGVLSCASMFGAVAGSFLTERLSHRLKKPMGMYLLTRGLHLFCLAALAFARSVPAFCAWFVLYYLMLGMHSTADDVLLHTHVPGAVRGSVMSVQSLLVSGGVAVSQLAAAAVLARGAIPALWLMQAAVLALGTALCLAWYLGTRWHRPPVNAGLHPDLGQMR